MARYGYDHIAVQIGFNAALSETLARLRESGQAVAAYVVLLALVGAGSDYLAAENAGAGGGVRIGVGVGTIIATYLLTEDMLRRCGQLLADLPRRYWAYIGQSIVASLGIGAGLILLVVPGIIVALRWSVAPALLIGRGEGAMDALSTSWRITQGHAMTIFLTGLVVLLPLLLVIFAGVAIEEFVGPSPAGRGAGLFVQNIGSSALSAVSSALGVAMFRLIDPDTEEMETVFA